MGFFLSYCNGQLLLSQQIVTCLTILLDKCQFVVTIYMCAYICAHIYVRILYLAQCYVRSNNHKRVILPIAYMIVLI